MKKLIISVALALGLIVPAFALAQTSTTGLLTVYVMVLNQTGYSAFQQYAPGNFNVSVSGNTASVSSFQGSQSGTPVQLYPGSYNVTVTSLGGYTPSYSTGCNNTIAAGQTQTCVVTMTPTYGYNYGYPYNTNNYNYSPFYNLLPPLSCHANVPSVAVGQPVTFTAVGGVGGTYNWVAPYTQTLNYPNAGTQITVAFQTTGQESVQVTNASQTATCSVLVTQGYYPYGNYTYPTYPNYPTTPVTSVVYPNTGYTYPNTTYPTYYPTTYPQLPRTGFGPHDPSLGFALSAVLLLAAGIAFSPYARKAFIAVGR